jgi:hypothetical protein
MLWCLAHCASTGISLAVVAQPAVAWKWRCETSARLTATATLIKPLNFIRKTFKCTKIPSSIENDKSRQQRKYCFVKLVWRAGTRINTVLVSIILVRTPLCLECACVSQGLYLIGEHCKARGGHSINRKFCVCQYNAVPETDLYSVHKKVYRLRQTSK